jgi:hypothetical protein
MRKYLVALLSLSLVLLGFLMNLLMPRHCPVTREAFGRIQKGMTQAEVHAILGGPPGDYRTRPYVSSSTLIESLSGSYQTREAWEGDVGIVEVFYFGTSPPSPGSTVLSRYFRDAEPCEYSPLGLARWRLGKLWSKLVP